MQETPRRLSILWLVVALVGCGMTLAALLMITLAFILPSAVIESYAVVLAGVGLIAAMLGIGLLVEGVNGWKSQPSRPLTTRRGWIILLLVWIVLGVVSLFIPDRLQSSPVFAPFHFGMIVLPTLSGMLLIIRLSGKHFIPTFRQLIVAITGGVSSVVVALPLEIVGFIVVTALVFAGASVFPAGQAEVSRLLSIIQLWANNPPTNIESMLSIASSPVVVVGLILILSGLIPIIEEFVKTLVMGIMGIWMRPGLGLAFIWGVSCGLGFAMVEGISNGSIGLSGEGWWLGVIFARLMASMMQSLTSGLLGLGWASLWNRKWWRLPLFYIAAVAIHGLWNLSVVCLVIGGIVSSTQSELGLVLALLGGSLLLLMILLVVVALIAIPLMLKRKGNKKTLP